MPTVQLTDRFCQTAKAIDDRTDWFDETVQGLALRVTKGGHRSWCYHYRSPRDGKRARATIGSYPSTSLAAARGRADEARGHVEAGNDPRLVLAGQATAGMTLAGLVTAYLDDLKARGDVRSVAEIERRLAKNVTPLIGEVKLDQLRRGDFRTVTDAIVKRGAKTEAVRVFEDARAMCRWGVQADKLAANPMDGMAKPAEVQARDRVLTDGEIRTLWHGLPKALARSAACQAIVKLCLLTGQRSGEVAGMVPAEIDLKAREWKIPAARSKNGHGHTVPLSAAALDIVKAAMAAAGESKALFGLSSMAVARSILRANEISKERPKGRFKIDPWSMHDLRRTVLDNMARLGIAPMTIAAVANHRSVTAGGVTFKHYVTYDYAKEKRQALDTWAERLTAIIGEGAAKVLPMSRGRR
jgi:integrase